MIAILITIMVLNLRTPGGTSWSALGHEVPQLLAYLLSFVYLGIYWNNHHHMLAAVSRVSGAALWANLQLLFWLSLVPFTTAWMSEHRFRAIPTAVYGLDLLAAAAAYYILQTMLVRADGPASHLRAAVGTDLKGKISPALYILGIGLTFADRSVGLVVYVAVALMWLVPDRRVERQFTAAVSEGDDLGHHHQSSRATVPVEGQARRHALADFDVVRDMDGTAGEVEGGRTSGGGGGPK